MQPATGIVNACQSGKKATPLNFLFFMLNISFLPKYRARQIHIISVLPRIEKGHGAA